MTSKLLVAGLALVATGPLAAQQGADARAANANPPQDVASARPARPTVVPNARSETAAPGHVRLPRSLDGGGLSILVYSNNTIHQLAQQAATNLAGAGAVVATTADFNTQLAAGPWDAVAVDCPSTIPTGGWQPLIDYVDGGGSAILSFWDWDNSSGQGMAGLPEAFDVTVNATISFVGQTLFDSGTSSVFTGVPVPNADWHNHWGDDGDNFNLLGGATGLAHLGSPATPCLVLGNGGSTIAAPAFDEAGDMWLAGGGVRLWENMINEVIGGGPSTRAILVYDNNTMHNLAQQAALNIEPSAVIASTADFNMLLTSQPWDAVVVDCPSFPPTGGWTDLIDFVDGGGTAILSFWDWDNDSGQGDPALPGAFDVDVFQSISLVGATLSGTVRASDGFFAGVTLPNSDWHDHWFDDGDEFTTSDRGARYAHIGTPGHPTIVRGNGGRTVASLVLDEAGDTWLSDGSGVRLWENMIGAVLSADSAVSAPARESHDPTAPAAFVADGAPVAGGLWSPRIDHQAFALDALLDFVLLAPAGATANVPLGDAGTLCVDPARAFVVHAAPAARFRIPIPPSLAAQRFSAQTGSVTRRGVRLGDAVDLVVRGR